MSSSALFSIRRLTPADVALMESMSKTFGDAFDQLETYGGARPTPEYLARLLGGECFIALAALKGGGGPRVAPTQRIDSAVVYLIDSVPWRLRGWFSSSKWSL
jgi:hypothetical protein